MKTSQQLTSPSGEDESTFSLADFPASHSVMPASEEARRMTATSGRSLSALSPKSDPLGSLVRMLLESSRWSSRARLLRWQAKPLFSTRVTEFEDIDMSSPSPLNASAQTLRVSDIQSNRYLFQLAPLELPTDETGCSSSQEDVEILPTPQTQGLKVCDENGKTQFIDLNLLPTVRANQVTSCDLNNPKLAKRNKSNLEEEVAKMVTNGMLPTPTTDIFKNAGISEDAWEKRIADGRQEDVVMAVYKKYKEADMLDAVKDGRAFRLSPLFTEEMMGFPYRHTTMPFSKQEITWIEIV